MNLDVMFYNVQFILPGYADHQRAHKLRSFLLQNDRDIIGLCEVFFPTLRRILLDDKKIRQRYPYQVINHGGEGKIWMHSGLVILSKYPIEQVERIEFENQREEIFPSNMFTKRDLIFAELNIEGTHLGVFVTHLQAGHSPSAKYMRTKQIGELPNIISTFWDLSRPTLLMGDLNVLAEESQYQFLVSQLNELYDWWPAVHRDDPGYTYASINTRQIFMGSTRLDYIFSTPDLFPEEMTILKPNEDISSSIWEPEQSFSLVTTLLILFTLFFRIFDVPKAIILEYQRWKQGHDFRFQSSHDLSDHYAITASTRLHSEVEKPQTSVVSLEISVSRNKKRPV